MANQKKPTYCLNVALNSKHEVDGQNSWYVPTFRVNGTIPEDVYNITSALAAQHANYVAAEDAPPADSSEF